MSDTINENIKLLHDADLEIIKQFSEYCDEMGYTYYLSGGSLLGAVRHHGFIPWDDDADFTMPREDYEKFLITAPEKFNGKLQIVNYKTDLNYHYYITRLQDPNTKLIETRMNNPSDMYTHASIDIFPIDGTPNNRILRNIHYFRVMMHRAFMSLHYKDSIDNSRKRSKKEQLLLKVMLLLPTNKMFNAYNQKTKIDKLMRKYPIDLSNNIGCLMGAYRTNQIVPKEYFGKGAYYDFEGIKLRGPELYDKYLTQMYGDYMQIPDIKNVKIHYKIVEIHGKKVSEYE